MKDKERKHLLLRDVEISFKLDTESGVPFYRQIIQLVENHVSAGKLAPGDKLPTIRALSIALKINPNTIAKAYMEMEIRGIVNTQVGSGTYIANRNANRADETEKIKKKMEELILDLLKRAKVLGLDRDDIIEMLKKMGDR